MNANRNLVVIALVVLAGCASTGTGSSAQSVDLCTLINASKDFNGKMVTVTAVAEPTPHYYIALSDTKCPEKIVAVAVPAKIEKDPGYDNLSALLWTTYPEVTKRVNVQLAGRFMWKPDEVPSRILSLSEVEKAEEIADQERNNRGQTGDRPRFSR